MLHGPAGMDRKPAKNGGKTRNTMQHAIFAIHDET